MLSLFIAAGLLAVLYVVLRRFVMGSSGTAGLLEAPQQVQQAAQRQGLAPVRGTPLVGAIPTPELCIASLGVAYAQMDESGEVPEQAIQVALVRHLKVEPPVASDYRLLGEWITAQRGGPSPAFAEMTRRLKQLDHGVAFDKLMRVLGDISAAGHRGMPSAQQSDALGSLAAVFRTA